LLDALHQLRAVLETDPAVVDRRHGTASSTLCSIVPIATPGAASSVVVGVAGGLAVAALGLRRGALAVPVLARALGPRGLVAHRGGLLLGISDVGLGGLHGNRPTPDWWLAIPAERGVGFMPRSGRGRRP